LKEAFKRYYPFLKNFKLYFFFVLIGISMTIFANVATAHIMQPMMDKLFIAKEEAMLITVPLMMLGIYFVKAIGRYIQSVFTSYIGQHIVTEFRSAVLDKMLSLDMSFISSARSGELISRIVNDIARIQYFVSLMLPEFIRELFTVIALIGYVLYLNAELAFYSLIILPIVILPIAALSRKLRKISYGSQEKNADLLSRLSEIFNNVELVKSSASEDFELKKFAKENWELFKINMKAVYFNELSSPILEIVGALSLAVVIFLGAKDVYADKMSVGEFMAFLTAVGLVFQPARGLGIIYTKMQDALAASSRVFEVLDKESEIADGKKILSGIRSIEYRDVVLDYGNKRALDGISFRVQQPRRVALIGDSGGGKSSVINLLLRLYDRSNGVIEINEEDIKNYKISSLREHIAVVSQRVYIFNDSLAYNVAYGKAFDEQKVIQALKKAHAYEFVKAMPDGIYTVMQEFGSNLSGGQRQRIALARALYKDASVLVLDEATSALDNESEAEILKIIESEAKQKIVIAIAHRLQSVADFDELLLFSAGKIVARGSHSELLASSTLYKSLYEKSQKES
jgi:subfamily B ATP-binding cassette protein MsbA